MHYAHSVAGGAEIPGGDIMIDDPLTGPAVAGLATAGICALALAVGSRLGRHWPTIAAPVVAVALCWPLAETPPTRFPIGDAWSYHTGVTAALTISLAAFGLAALEARDDVRRRWLAAAVAAVAAGAFLCIPETGVLSLTPGPLIVTAAAVLLVPRIRPIGPAAAVATVVAVTWLALAGGTSRPASVLGLSSGLALAAAAAIAPGTVLGRRFGTVVPLGVVMAAVVVARVAGTTPSSTAAALLAAASLAAVGAARAAARRAGALRPAGSEQLEGPQRK